jgi:type VI secretion system protein ImpJ
MRQLQPVVWAKGVLLTPQHLQIQDRYLEDLLSFRLDGLAFAPWGFDRLVVNREELAAGSFALASASGVFPDGLPFDVPSSDPAPAPRPLKENWRQDQLTLDVFLTVPQYQAGGVNVADSPAQTGTRFRSTFVNRRDENTGLAEKPIRVASKNLRFLVTGESLDGSSVLPVARIQRRETGEYDLDPHFVPPLVNFAASDYLAAITSRLVQILAAKSTTISGGRRQRKESQAEFAERDVASFWLLHTVNSHFPRLRHLLEQKRAHPVVLYQAFTGLAGALTTFSDQLDPTRDFPQYDHGDLGTCFTRLDVMLRDLLDAVVPERAITLPLRPVSESVHATALDEDRYLQAARLFLAVRSSATASIGRASALLKVSAGNRLDELIKSQLPGIEIRRVNQAPSEVPVKLDYHYFEVTRQGPEWEAIRMARNLAVYVPKDLTDPKLELVIVLPDRAAEGPRRTR